jgi:hypothetical protein
LVQASAHRESCQYPAESNQTTTGLLTELHKEVLLLNIVKRTWLLVTVVIIIGCVYTIINGTPWGKYAAKKQCQDYLTQHYGSHMVMEKVIYNFDESTYFNQKYYGIAHPKDQPSVKVRLYQDPAGQWNDTYGLQTWVIDIKTTIRQLLAASGHEDAIVTVTIPTPTPTLPLGNSEGHGLDLEVLTFQELQNEKEQFPKILQFLQALQKKELPLESIKIYYNKKWLGIPGQDLSKLTDISSLPEYLKQTQS